MDEAKWYLRTLDETFGPETEAQLVAWARVGRIQPGQEISDDNVIWRKVEEVPFLDMRFSIDLGDGNPRGPYNKAAAEALIASGRLPPTARIVETREPFPEDRGETPPEGDAPEAEVPAGKVVERIVEVPVEKVVEVAPPPRTTVVADVVEDPVGAAPPVSLSGIFKDVPSDKLKALEAAAQREIAAVGKRKFGGFFGRR